MVGDTVLMLGVGDSYVIVGSIKYQVAPADPLNLNLTSLTVKTIINNEVQTATEIANTALSTANTANTTATNHDGRLISMENLIGKKITSDMKDDNNGNMNIDYMYVDPSTGQLKVRRKNGVWTFYNRAT